jgi:hypothetical protein
LIPITRLEKDFLEKNYPDVYITCVNSEHPSRAKGYYATADNVLLKVLYKTSVYARRELIETLEFSLRRYKDKDRKLTDEELKEKARIENEIVNLKALGI